MPHHRSSRQSSAGIPTVRRLLSSVCFQPGTPTDWQPTPGRHGTQNLNHTETAVDLNFQLHKVTHYQTQCTELRTTGAFSAYEKKVVTAAADQEDGKNNDFYCSMLC